MTDNQKHAAAALRDQLTVMGQRDIPTNRDGFDDEFDSLRNLDHRTRQNHDEFYSSLLGSNMSKNRYSDVLPNEATRVVLDPINVRGDGDYINANYIDGRRLFGVPFVYIATQAPLRSTVGDFWRMVFENNTAFVVMLCAEIEAGKQKSEKYWPDGQGGVLSLGPLSLVLLSENHRADTIFRTILIRTVDGKERKVFHMQYVRWPDQGIPQSSAPLMEIIVALGRSPLSTQTPIVVHCSGGVGRTGVFITLHVALALFQLEKPVSVPHVVQYLKLCRTGMVQRKDQYLFAYYAILREMERMVWSVEQTALVDSKVHQDGRQVPLPRRPSEHVPSHVAQHVGEIPRTPVVAFGGQQRQGGGGMQAEHGIKPSRQVPTRAVPADDEFGPSVQSAFYDPDRDDNGGSTSAAANTVEDQLRQLQMKTKSMRSNYGGFVSNGTAAKLSSFSAGNGGGAYSSGYFASSSQYVAQPQARSTPQQVGRSTPPVQPTKLVLDDPKQPPNLSSTNNYSEGSLPPLSVMPQLNLGGSGGVSRGGGGSVNPTLDIDPRPIAPSRLASTARPSEEPARPFPAAGVAVKRSDDLFFSPEPSKPSAQQQQQQAFSIPPSSFTSNQGNRSSSEPTADPPGQGATVRSVGDTRPSDLSAAARDFNSALFAPVGGNSTNGQQNFTSSGRGSNVRKADVGLL